MFRHVSHYLVDDALEWVGVGDGVLAHYLLPQDAGLLDQLWHGAPPTPPRQVHPVIDLKDVRQETVLLRQLLILQPGSDFLRWDL